MHPKRYSLRSSRTAKPGNGAEKGRSDSLLLTVVLSLISGIVGVAVGQGIDFFKTRELQREQERSQIQQHVWDETTDIYRQLYSMRSRLNGSLIAFRFAVIEQSYMDATRATASPASPSQIEEQRKMVEAATVRVVHDRTELESLLGWVDLSAPPSDQRWEHAIQSLVRLDRWSPGPTAATSSLPAWKEAERLRAYELCTKEINAKFAELLILLRENRRELVRQAAGPQ